MDRQIRYIWNWGLAFDEDRLIKRLEALAQEGWMLEGMSSLRYRLRKGQPQALRYAMDYRKLNAEEEQDYLSLFSAEGWEHVCSLQGFHFFCANVEALSIHTERASKEEKYSGFKQGSFWTMVISAILFAFFFMLGRMHVLAFLGQGEKWVMAMLLAVSAAVFAPSLMMVVAYWMRMRKIERGES